MEKEKSKGIKRNMLFEKLCCMSQQALKLYLVKELKDLGYADIISEDGYIYAKGSEPVLLLAHMDTVHAKQIETFYYGDDSNKIFSNEGIGGDDRCGIYMILKILKDNKCSVLFTEDEERGCVGANKFVKSEYINSLEVNYMLEFDRKNASDAVFYSCDNPEFEKFITTDTGFKTATGSCSDISKVAPASKIAAVNLSCGYYNQHTIKEYVLFSEMELNIERAKGIIAKECEKPYEYIEKKYTSTYSGRYNGYDYDDYYGSYYGGKREPYWYSLMKEEDVKKKFESTYTFKKAVEPLEEENFVYEEHKGITETEAIGNYLVANPDLTFSSISGVFKGTIEDLFPTIEEGSFKVGDCIILTCLYQTESQQGYSIGDTGVVIEVYEDTSYIMFGVRIGKKILYVFPEQIEAIEKEFKIGDLVVSTTRPELGIGIVQNSTIYGGINKYTSYKVLFDKVECTSMSQYLDFYTGEWSEPYEQLKLVVDNTKETVTESGIILTETES